MAQTEREVTNRDHANRLLSGACEQYETLYGRDAAEVAKMVAARGGEAHIKRTATGLWKVRCVGDAQLSDW